MIILTATGSPAGYPHSQSSPQTSWQSVASLRNVTGLVPLRLKRDVETGGDRDWDWRSVSRCPKVSVLTRPGKPTKNDGTARFLMGKSTISMVIFSCYDSFLYVYQRVNIIRKFQDVSVSKHTHTHTLSLSLYVLDTYRWMCGWINQCI